jgi:hypothetical protein
MEEKNKKEKDKDDGLTLRSVNVNFWTDPYVMDKLDPLEKLLFLYCFTNKATKLCGVYEISMKTVGVETGLDADMVKKILSRFEGDKKVFLKDNTLIVANYKKHQKYNPSMLINVKRTFMRLSEDIRKYIIELNVKSINELISKCGLTVNEFLSGNSECSDFNNGEEYKEPGPDHEFISNIFVDSLTHPNMLFSDSVYARDKDLFKKHFYTDIKYFVYDADHYYETISNWSTNKGKKSKNWIASAHTVAMKDEKEYHAVYRKLSDSEYGIIIDKYGKDNILLFLKNRSRYYTTPDSKVINVSDFVDSMNSKLPEYLKASSSKIYLSRYVKRYFDKYHITYE